MGSWENKVLFNESTDTLVLFKSCIDYYALKHNYTYITVDYTNHFSNKENKQHNI